MNKINLPETIGVVGLGLIGCALARRLIAAGVTVRGFDPEPNCMAQLEVLGGQPLPADQIWGADCVISAVFSTDQLADLVARAPVSNGGTVISVSTCDPSMMPGIAEEATKKGYDLIEAPISGTSADLAWGDAILLVAGDEAIADDLAIVFQVLSRAHFHVGVIGNGNRAKLAINLVLGLSRAAVAEGVVFAKAVGLEPADFLDLALQSAAASKVMASKGPKMVARDFTPLGRVTQSAKDFGLIYEQAMRAGQGLPMAQRYLEIVADSLAQGEGDLDNSAVMLAIERTSVPNKEPADR
jgi:3-hydroxyisobutyrate dehydrogenase-like beta-hydroxyacid dehydrogenase